MQSRAKKDKCTPEDRAKLEVLCLISDFSIHCVNVVIKTTKQVLEKSKIAAAPQQDHKT